MSRIRPTLRLFLDEGVPDAVGQVFESHNHDVIYLREAIVPGSPDPLVCAVAQANSAILVALDTDMRQIAKEHSVGKQRFARLNLLHLSCGEPQAANRVEQAMSLIEHEWSISDEKVARRLHVVIRKSSITTNR